MKQIKEITQEKSVDVIGIVHSISQVTEIKLKNGTTKPKRVIEILDNSETKGIQISFTIWGDLCFSLQINEGDVIAVKGGKISLYGGKTLN